MVKLDEKKIIKPDAIYGTAPFWAWNGTMTPGNIKAVIQELKESGFGGAFVHPRPGLTNEYLSEEWFELWGIALEEAKSAGLKLYIYDENTYPTGYAGGHILSQLPDCAARSVKVRIFSSCRELLDFVENPCISQEERNFIRLYSGSCRDGKLVIKEDITDLTEGQIYAKKGVCIGACMQQPYSSAWFGGFSNADILRPEVTKLLLENTYEAYYQRFQSEFGDSIPAVFSDEPGISPGCVYLEDPMVFPFSRYLSSEFYRRRGYSMEDNMVSIVLDIDGVPGGIPAEQVRFDYYCTLRELWIENFAKPIRDWCQLHNIVWTGHFLDEHWPYPWGNCSPAVMSMYEYMQWPGIDMLMSHMLKEDGKSAMLLSVMELASAGTQLGKERLLCECYGAGGWDAGITDFKRIGDWLGVHGITFFNQHMMLTSVSGVRKQGHPQSFDSREPWWDEYAKLTPYYARLSYILSQGVTKHRILLIHPTTGWFLKLPQTQKGDILWGFEKMSKVDPIRTYIEFIQLLTANLVGFDLGDEFLLQKYGRVEGSHLIVGEAVYDIIVLPEELKHLLSSTVTLLQDAQQSGIPLIGLGELPQCVDGKACLKPDIPVTSMGKQEFLDFACKKGMQIIPFHGNGIEGRRKSLPEGGEFCFLTNSTPVDQECTMELPDVPIWVIDLFTGEKEAFCKNTRNGKTNIMLHSCGSLMLYWDVQPDKEILRKYAVEDGNTEHTAVAELCPDKVSMLEDNVLVLDYGNLYLREQKYENIHVMAACDKVFHAHGMEQNPWDMTVQFKKRYTDRNQFDTSSGFVMEYNFEIAELPDRLFLAIEHPEFYQAEVNGREICLKENTVWLDDEFGKFDIRNYAVKGKNTVRILASPFNVNMEIQPVYILGCFKLGLGGENFVILEDKPLTTGGLKEQGVVFYGGRVRYQYLIMVEELQKDYGIQIDNYNGTALSVWVNGRYAGQAGIGMGDRYKISPYLKCGMNEIRIELSCSLKNLFGPFHTNELIRNSAWPAAWRQAPKCGMPLPANYDIISYGLTGPVTLYVR